MHFSKSRQTTRLHLTVYKLFSCSPNIPRALLADKTIEIVVHWLNYMSLPLPDFSRKIEGTTAHKVCSVNYGFTKKFLFLFCFFFFCFVFLVVVYLFRLKIWCILVKAWTLVSGQRFDARIKQYLGTVGTDTWKWNQ